MSIEWVCLTQATIVPAALYISCTAAVCVYILNTYTYLKYKMFIAHINLDYNLSTSFYWNAVTTLILYCSVVQHSYSISNLLLVHIEKQ